MPKWVQQVIESKDMDKIQGLCFNVDAHISTMKKVETCVGGSDVCKDDKGALLVKFKKGMHERIDKIMEKSNKDRHVESCKMMAKMFKAKMAKKMQDNQE